jgi:DNA-binding XRE family transcriptional regulator
MTASVQTIALAGARYVILPEADYRSLTAETGEPPLPPPDARGNYPAVETMQVLIARDILRSRRAAGLTQVELARRAGIRAETLSRIEKGRHSPSIATVDKIDQALRQAEAAEPAPAKAKVLLKRPKRPGRKRK